ncbi:hypothetical protein D3C76_1852950 [compost metagenome]
MDGVLLNILHRKRAVFDTLRYFPDGNQHFTAAAVVEGEIQYKTGIAPGPGYRFIKRSQSM